MSIRIYLRLVVVLVAGLLAVPAVACAIEAKPFEITKFTMGTTRTVQTPSSLNGNIDEFEGFRNEPYSFTQAGGHPDTITTTIEFSSEVYENEGKQQGGGGNGNVFKAIVPTRDPKDIVADLPPGLLADPQAVPRCPLVQVTNNSAVNDPCPATTQVGVARLRFYGGNEFLGPIVNLTPEAGQSAEFGLENTSGVTYLITGHVVRIREASGHETYGLTAVTNEIPMVELSAVELAFWGVPAAASHDPQRGVFCGGKHSFEGTLGHLIELPFGDGYCSHESTTYCLSGEVVRDCSGGGESSGVAAVPFWTMGSDCAAGGEVATLRADSWEEPGSVREGRYTGYVERSDPFPGVTGCNLLAFNPELEVKPDAVGADEPVGLGVDLRVPQDQEPAGVDTPQLRDLDVTLPEGLSISPGIVDGIQACNESGPEGINFSGPESEETGLNGELQLAPGHCPDASTVGTATAYSPLLNEPLEGHVYLARPGCGGPGEKECTPEDAADGNLYQLYLELGGKGALGDAGVNLKVRLKTDANPATGQLTTVTEENPQLPFSELKVKLNGGPRSPLDNPAVCGAAVTTSDWTPWSAPGVTPAPESLLMPGTPDATPSSHYVVEPQGCPGTPGLSPGFTAGTVSPQAGQYSAFTLNLSRQDREQFVKGIQVHTPPGLLGMLSSVPLCGEPAADTGTCPESSKIGTTRVASGAGSHPFEIEGNVYLTEKYGGAPFGLSIVTRAVAGPFNLGLVIVRARIAVNPENSTLTITTDETGPYAIPQILDGVPLRLQRVTVDIDRPGFMFNPTNCSAQQITAVVSGSQNASASVSSPFAVAGCKSLAFKPTFTASTSAHTSRKDGASLDVKLSYPKGSVGSQANIAKVKVELPKLLPSELKTLQKACLASVFETNPAACPAASVVGIAKASTPVLPVELKGPVYFVSHGGEAFPSLVVVLQGDGVRVDLTGSTLISKGITSSTFKTVPDVPVNTFELYLPESKDSALAAPGGDLCQKASKLVMPTQFTAQNGATIKQTTKIAVMGCAKSKKAKKHQTRRKKTARARKAGIDGRTKS